MSLDPNDLFSAVVASDFMTFAYRAFRELNGLELKRNWHHRAIAQALVDLGGTRKLCIFLPPRNLKSFLVSVAWPAWMLGRDPRTKFLCASYGADLADDHARACLRLMTTPFYMRAFPGTRLANRKAVYDFRTTKGGGRRSTSVGGPSTGFGADYTIIDDPSKADDANSEAALQKALDWYQGSIATRGNDKNVGAQILVMQRLHEHDLGGYLEGSGWPVLCLPAINDWDRRVPISAKRHHVWKEGELLHPEHESQAISDELLAIQGPRRFSAQYLQRPLPERGNIVQRDWLKTYEGPPEALNGGQVIQSWDVAASLSDKADYSACVTIRKIGNIFYVLDVYRGRLAFGELRAKVEQLGLRWRASAILVENTSSGIGLVQDLNQRPVPNLATVIAINPGVQSKVDRVDAQTALIAAGDLRLPSAEPWLGDFMHELLGFPNTKHDDMVDALSQLLKWAKRLTRPANIAAPEVISILESNYSEDYRDHGVNQPCAEWLNANSGYAADPWL